MGITHRKHLEKYHLEVNSQLSIAFGVIICGIIYLLSLKSLVVS